MTSSETTSSETKMRVILLTHGGYEEIVDLLVAIERVELASIFVETNIVRQYSAREKVRRSLRYDGYLATLTKVGRYALGLNRLSQSDEVKAQTKRELLAQLAAARGVPIHFVADFHAADSLSLMRAAAADLGVILGTNILKPSVFKIPRLGSINLHQARAPHYRGGPPIFWELYNGETEVGLTVHFVEPQVDTGEIILQQTVPLHYDAAFGLNYEAFIGHFIERLRERCVHLVADAVRQIAEGTATPWVQDVSSGRRYRLPTKREKDEMRFRLRKRQRVSLPQQTSCEVRIGED